MCHKCHFAYDGVSDRLRTMDRGYLIGNKNARGSGKLSDEDAVTIRQLLQGGYGLRQVARLYGVGHASIAKIRDGKTHQIQE
jgi:transposase-like protein